MKKSNAATYLLILACSQRKRQDIEPLPAIERYDGGSFRVLRKAQKAGYLPGNLDVLILSAKYGLIESSTAVTNYEQRMNHKRSTELRSRVIEVLKLHVKQKKYKQIYIDLGQDYFPAVEGLEELANDSQIIQAQGQIGKRLAALKNWLMSHST